MNSILTVSERESGGRIAQRRLEYQTHWGATRALQLYNLKNEFGLAFEFHDDLFEISSLNTATKVKCFQLKTKSKGAWSTSEVISLEAGRSILSKLLENGLKFEASFDGAYLVSNVSFKFASQIKSPLRSTNEKDQEKIRKHIHAVLDGAADHIIEKVEFWSDGPPLDTFEKVFIGELAEFIETHLGDINCNIKAVSRTLVDMCRGKSQRESTNITDLRQLLTFKFVTNKDIEKLLETVRAASIYRPQFADAATQCPVCELPKLRTWWPRYDLNRRNVEDLIYERLKSEARNLIATQLPNSAATTISEFAIKHCQELLSRLSDISHAIDDGACFVALFYEQLCGDWEDETGGNVQKADKKPQEVAK